MTDRPRRFIRDPYGLLPPSSVVGPLLALVGLVIVAILTVGLFQGRIPFVVSGGGPGLETPAPSGIVVDPRADVPGSIAYAKAGAIFVQSGKDVRQLTTGPLDSMPAWSADGQWVYFVRTVSQYARWPINGAPVDYQLTYPILMRVAAAGGQPHQLATGKFSRGSSSWFFWIRQPAPDPADPSKVAVISDGPDPLRSDAVLQLFDATAARFTVVKGLTEVPPLGHQDPTWRPDGRMLLYTRNDREAQVGTPAIWRWDPATGKSQQVTPAGYLQPSWSPDGRLIAATKTGQFGTDVVVLDPATGSEIMRITTDGSSFAPAWSPRGDAIAYLHVTGGIVDLRMASLSGTATGATITDTIDLTTTSGLDGASRPSWYIPADQIPSPAPSASGLASPTASGPAGGSSGPAGGSSGSPPRSASPSP